MDFWDGSANSLALLDNTHSTAGYTQAYIHRPDAIDDTGDSENARPLAFTDYRTFGSNSDLIILTSDYVCFHLHSDTLQAASHNDFNHILQDFNPGDRAEFDANPMFTVPDTSIVFTMIVCAIYGLPFAEYSPSFATLDLAVDGMKTYGLSVEVIIAPNTPLYEIILTHAETYSLELYALAAYHDLYDLAVVASSYLLSFQLSSLSDEMAARIGALYLKRLFFMHLGRAEALRRFLLPPPYPHPPTETCDHAKQMALTRAWALAASSLAWDPRVGTPAQPFYWRFCTQSPLFQMSPLTPFGSF